MFGKGHRAPNGGHATACLHLPRNHYRQGLYVQLNLRIFLSGIAARFAGAGILFILSILAARWMAPSAAGEFFFFIAVSNIAIAVSKIGFDQAVVKKCSLTDQSQTQEALSARLTSAIMFVVITGLVCASVLGVVFALTNTGYETSRYALLLLFTIPASNLVHVASGALRVLGRLTLALFTQTGLIPLIAILMLIGLHAVAEVNLDRFAIVYLVASGLGALILYGVVVGQNPIGAKPFSKAYVLDCIKPGFNIMWATAAFTIMSWVDVVIVRVMLGTESAGYYTVAVRMTSLIGLIVIAINGVLGPSFAQRWHCGDRSGLRRLAQQGAFICTLLGLPAALLVVLFRHRLLDLFFGSLYAPAAPIVLILVLGQTVNALTGPVSHVLFMTSGDAHARRIMTLAIPFHLALMTILIQWGGILGAALATATTMSLINLSMVIVAYRLTGVFIAPRFPVLR